MPESGLIYRRARQRCCRKCGSTRFIQVSYTLEYCANPSCHKYYRKGRGMSIEEFTCQR